MTNQANRAFIVFCSIFILFQAKAIFADEMQINQQSHGNNSPNISAKTVNISGLSRKQQIEINNKLDKISESAKELHEKYDSFILLKNKSLQEIDDIAFTLYRRELKNLPTDSKKYAEIVASTVELTMKNFEALERKVEKQNNEKIELSNLVKFKIRNLFDSTLNKMDENISALQIEGSLGITYEKSKSVEIFVTEKTNQYPLSIGKIQFRNGSELQMELTPGTLTDGMYTSGPVFKIYQYFRGNKSEPVSIEQSIGGGRMVLSTPLAYTKSIQAVGGRFKYEPRNDNLVEDDFQEKFTKTITELILFVYYKDSKL